MSTAEVKERSAATLVGQFVKVKSNLPGGEIFGFFTEVSEDQPGDGFVYEFLHRRYVKVTASNCTPVPIWNLTGGFKDHPVSIVDFGDGVVYDEFCDGRSLKLRVRNPKGLMTTVPFSQVQLRLPPRR